MKKIKAMFSMPEKPNESLKKTYLEAETDPDRMQVLADWKDLDIDGWE